MENEDMNELDGCCDCSTECVKQIASIRDNLGVSVEEAAQKVLDSI